MSSLEVLGRDVMGANFYARVFVGADNRFTTTWVHNVTDVGHALYTGEGLSRYARNAAELEAARQGATGGAELFGNHAGKHLAVWTRGSEVLASLHNDDKSWQTPVTVVSAGDAALARPSAAVSEGGVVTLAWSQSASDVDATIYYRQYSGEQWLPAIELDPGYRPVPHREPVVIADRAGGTHIMWQRDNAMHHTRLDASGQTTDIADLPYAGNISSQSTDLPLRVAAGNFNLTALWGVGRSGTGSNLVATSWAPSGHWLEPVVVNDPASEVTQADLELEPEGRGLIVWLAQGQLWSRYIDGVTLDAPVRIDDGEHQVTYFDMAMDALGRVTVAWMEAQPARLMVRKFE